MEEQLRDALAAAAVAEETAEVAQTKLVAQEVAASQASELQRQHQCQMVRLLYLCDVMLSVVI